MSTSLDYHQMYSTQRPWQFTCLEWARINTLLSHINRLFPFRAIEKTQKGLSRIWSDVGRSELGGGKVAIDCGTIAAAERESVTSHPATALLTDIDSRRIREPAYSMGQPSGISLASRAASIAAAASPVTQPRQMSALPFSHHSAASFVFASLFSFSHAATSR